MDELQELFGEESLSYADFTAKLNEKGIKLANIKAGGYVDKGKYDKLAGEYAKYKQENDVSKYADYEQKKKKPSLWRKLQKLRLTRSFRSLSCRRSNRSCQTRKISRLVLTSI